MKPGVLALVGGAEWHSSCDFDRYLLEKSGSKVVTVLPTAAAYEKPEASVEFAAGWFSSLGATVEAVMVISRGDADDPAFANRIADSSFIYIGGGSPMHLFSVLKDSECYQAILKAFRGGAVLAASSAGAMVLGDPMIDPRGGGLTLGLGLVRDLAVMPHYSSTAAELRKRTISLAEPDVVIAGIDEQTALVREPDGRWHRMGAGSIHLVSGGSEISAEDLVGKVELSLQ